MLIDWCIFGNKAADWFTHGVIAIYVTVSTASCLAIKPCKTGARSSTRRFDQDQENFYGCPQSINQIICFEEAWSLSIKTLIMFMLRSRKVIMLHHVLAR